MESISPVFVIGSYRSGTSVLTWALGQHPNILPLEETNWIYRSSVDFYNMYDLGSSYGEFSHLGSIGWNREKYLNYFGTCIHSFIEDSRADYIKYSSAQQRLPENQRSHFSIKRRADDPKRRWVDGTPENSHYVYGLSLLFPNAKFIHILRNPKKVARSLMNFSTMGQHDYPEEQAYFTWKRLVSDCVLAEKAFGNQKVLRIYQEDLEVDPKGTIEQCMHFLGEEFHEDCLRPLHAKINSSTYQNDFDSSIESNLNSKKDYERGCFEFYKEILEQYEIEREPDLHILELLKDKFENYCRSQRPSEVDKIIEQKEIKIAELESKLLLMGLPVIIKKYGPENIHAGESYNIQPDGMNAIWVEGNNITSSCVVCINDMPLLSSVHDQHLITAKVPNEITKNKGILKLNLLDQKTGRTSNILVVEIH
ncbi:Sulfotransferase domain-containing protein [Paenibacillus tianmuensis]|uniref:Sulfotransferase domain-containing protein n=1 Tax=Paenibacillus tianmuensis TaxID=624147 RepID=A0A1G4TXT9_9BACL|nr:sulfotransferase [Paenibacillus tianmuensis]SCW85485.1 Sulfotransferase domain-containing protein [Paenibacillus tianmuensis]